MTPKCVLYLNSKLYVQFEIMKAAESYPTFSVQYSLLMKQLYNVAGSKALSMTSNIVYMILSRSFVNINQLHASWTFFFSIWFL